MELHHQRAHLAWGIPQPQENGELFWESLVISPLLDATGKGIHFVGVKEDITEAKRSGEA